MDEILEMLSRIGELTDTELADLEQRCIDELNLLKAGDLSDDVLATMTQLANGVDSIRTQQGERAQAAAERQAKVDEIMARVTPPEEPVAETQEEETQEEETTTEEAEQEAEQTEEAKEEAKPEAIAAAATTEPKRPKISDINARRPERLRPRVSPQRVPVITASADIPGVPAGARLRGPEDIAKAMIARHAAFRGPANGYEQIPVVSFRAQYPEDRMLGQNAVLNDERIKAVTSPQAIVASGGYCAPLAPVYTLANISQASRPIRDALAQFGAQRGGIRYISPPHLPDAAGAVGVWTVEMDETVNGYTKACLHIDCGEEILVDIDAITRCLEFGNFGARAFPEQVVVWNDLAMANHARAAERRLLDQIITNSTAVSAGQGLGTTRDVLAVLDRAVAAYRNRHRTTAEMPMHIIIPEWLDDNMRTDLARELPGSNEERLATADAKINSFYAVRNINVTRSLEGPTGSGQDWGAQGAGALLGWPTAVTIVLYHEGAHLFLDGGTLDLGLVRDSTLNATNDYRVFAETFEQTAFLGIESLAITLDICPSGTTSAPTDFDPCTQGS